MKYPAMMDSEPQHPLSELRYTTPPEWVEQVMSDTLILLNDHAHLEKKAAINALDMLNRWPEPCPPETWVQSMTAIARDEVEHLGAVNRLIHRRGGKFYRYHANSYANDLRKLVRMGGRGELVDRLMVSALIEARSCERFQVLSAHCEDVELAKLYRGLFASEHGHYQVFINLAETVPYAERVPQRWDEMLDAEADIIAAQEPGPRMHSGIVIAD